MRKLLAWLDGNANAPFVRETNKRTSSWINFAYIIISLCAQCAWPVARSIFDTPACCTPLTGLRGSGLLSTFLSDRLCCFNNKAWGPQAIRRAHPPAILNRFAVNEGLTTSDNPTQTKKRTSGQIVGFHLTRCLRTLRAKDSSSG